MPFWYVACPKCNKPVVSDNLARGACVVGGKNVRIVGKIENELDGFMLIIDVTMYYSTDNGISWREVEMKASGENYVGEIHGLPENARILYFLEATDIAGRTLVQDNDGEYFTYQV